MCFYFLLITAHCFSSNENPFPQIPDTAVADIDNTEIAEYENTVNENVSDEDVIKKKKEFLESFYNRILYRGVDYTYVKDRVSEDILQLLKKEYEYDCDDNECLAIWLFTHEGTDPGNLLSFTIDPIDTNGFLIIIEYEYQHFQEVISVGEESGGYVINGISEKEVSYPDNLGEQQNEITDETDATIVNDEDSVKSENKSESETSEEGWSFKTIIYGIIGLFILGLFGKVKSGSFGGTSSFGDFSSSDNSLSSNGTSSWSNIFSSSSSSMESSQGKQSSTFLQNNEELFTYQVKWSRKHIDGSLDPILTETPMRLPRNATTEDFKKKIFEMYRQDAVIVEWKKIY